jgi:hypothetical protein
MSFEEKLESSFESSKLKTLDKLDNFARFSRRQVVANFLNRYEIFKEVLNVHRSIIEGGVNLGQGLFSWLHFSSILEPYNHSRRVVGFDTFEGFTNVAKEDDGGLYTNTEQWKDFTNKQSFEEVQLSCDIQNKNRALQSIKKVEIVKGDATKTIPQYIDNNPHLIVALLHIDFDVYAPTKIALKSLINRMPKGGVIAFDEINDPNGLGETIALLETIGVRNFQLKRNSFDSNLSYIVL